MKSATKEAAVDGCTSTELLAPVPGQPSQAEEAEGAGYRRDQPSAESRAEVQSGEVVMLQGRPMPG